MIPTADQIVAVHKRYASSDTVFNLVYTHCRIVSEIALWCADNVQEPVNRDILQAACLLHDIGTYIVFNDEGEAGHNRYNYKQHAILGAALADEEGFDPAIGDTIRTHVLMGLTKQEIIEHNMPLPHKDYEPTTIEGRLLCYADRFHSKRPLFNEYQTFLEHLRRDLPAQADKFAAWSREFGIPDIQRLAAQYGHPVK